MALFKNYGIKRCVLCIVVFCFGSITLKSQQAAEFNRKADQIINEDPEKSLAFAEQAMQAAKQENDPVQTAYAHYNIGVAQYYLDDYDKAIRTIQQALRLAREKNEALLEGRCEGMIGEIRVYQAQYSKSLVHLSKARKLFEQENARVDLARCNNNMGIIHKNQYNYDEAIVYFKKALELGDNIRKGDASLYLGQVYNAKKLFTQADNYFNVAVELAGQNNDQYVLADALVGMGQVNLAFGKRDEALTHLSKALEIKEQLDDKQGIAIVCNTTGGLFLQANDPDKAHQLFLRSVKLASKINTKEELKDAYLGLSNTYHYKGKRR